ncbi:DUF637 domain-containing protein [Pseudomonas carnis]|nr:DUF637 domain-containing protein [Pseudomonas carnis]
MITAIRFKNDPVFRPSGQRYINGLASDDALFRYLMDNAISYKDSLNLQLGLSLTAEQVAALTHDIVWMEEAEINGQKVLTPVLYLAQANNRLAPNGALIQGQDVSLVTGGDLHNSGTLRATNNLSMVANNIDNSGLMQAGNRLEMLATDSVRNTRGGIINGRDISATAVIGDIINERTVTTFKQEGQGYQLRNDVASEASRFEATDTLKLNAGRDVLNLGSNLKAGGNASVTAGRDVLIASQTEQDDYAYQRRRISGTEQTILQHTSGVDVGGNLAIDARRDIAVVASTVSAAKDLSVKAGENLTLAAAANEQHDYSKGKKGGTKTTTQLDDVTQQSAELKAGGDLIAIAGTDLTLVASKISAGNEAYVHADNELQMLAAQDSHYSLYDMSKKGNWGSKKTQRDEVTDVKSVGSEIKTGGDLTLESGGDQKYQAAKLESGGDIAIVSGGAVEFEAVKDLHQESHEKSKGDAFWTSSKGKGNTDETLRQTQMVAEGNIAIKAVEGLKIDVRQVNQQTVSQSIDAMVKADPQLAWIKDAEARGDVDWRQVKEIHDSFKYSNSGLGPASQIIIAIVMAAFVGPAAMGAMTTAGAGIGVAAGTGAIAAGAATNATVSAVNNRGNLGAVFKDVTSSDAMKGYAVSGLTAGFTAAYFDGWTGSKTTQASGKIDLQLNTLKGVGQFAANQTLQNGTSAVLKKALGQDADLGDALTSVLFNTLAATSFNAVGEIGLKTGSIEKVATHALVGGFIAEVAGGDFVSGAIAAGANEALANQLRRLATDISPEKRDVLLTTAAQLIGVAAAAVVDGGVDTKNLQVAAWAAQNATNYNSLNHEDAADFVADMNICGKDVTCQQKTWKAGKYDDISLGNYEEAMKTAGPAWAKSQITTLEGGLFALKSLNCQTDVCFNYKQTLEARAYENLDKLHTLVNTYEPYIAGIAGGVAGGVRPRQPTLREGETAGAQAGKSEAYWSKVKIETGGVKTPTSWQGSGPAPGVLGLEPGSVSSKAIQNYFPSTKNGSIEFVFDPKTSTFAVGKPTTNLGGSPHQQLAETIKSDGSALVGGMFRRGPNGEVITNEFSGHYWKNWTPEVRAKFEQALKQYDLNVKHHPGM